MEVNGNFNTGKNPTSNGQESLSNSQHFNTNSSTLPKRTGQPVQRQKSQSEFDLRHTDAEINNNRMGGVIGHGHSNSGLKEKGHRKGSDPSLRSSDLGVTHNADINQDKSSRTAHVQKRNSDRVVDNGGFFEHPDLLKQVNDTGQMRYKNQSKQGGEDLKGHMDFTRTKHDSGFASEVPLSSDEMYDSGFKLELRSQNGNMTSSPKAHRNSSDKRQKQSGRPYYQNSKVVHTNGYNSHPNKHVHSMENFPTQYSEQNGNRNKVSQNENRSESSQFVQKRPAPKPQVSKPRPSNTSTDRPSPKVSNGDLHHKGQGQRPRSSENPGRRNNTGSPRQRKSLGDVNEDKVLSFDNRQPVVKTKSMGDLSEGCTFSLVGQKKIEKVPSSMQGPPNLTEFTGTQMMKHIRKYKEMSQQEKTGSLPFRGKALDDMDTVNYMSDINRFTSPQLTAAENTSQNVRPMHYGSLQCLTVSTSDGQFQSDYKQASRATPGRQREQTPLKPRRCLPQTPAEAQEKKKQVSDLVKNRVSVSSCCSTSSPSSSNSNKGSQSDPRQRGISATPSDREVCVLLQGSVADSAYSVNNQPPVVCNTNNSGVNHSKRPYVKGQEDLSYNANSVPNNLRKSGSFGSNDHCAGAPSGGRLSESGQTTLTSQSTIDSGYITTDQDHETLSTSSYAKSLQQSAQNLFKRQSQKADNHLQYQNKPKGDYAKVSKGNHSNTSGHVKDSHAHTRNWLENHPGTFMNEHYKMGLSMPDVGQLSLASQNEAQCDNNNNKQGKVTPKYTSELNLTQSHSQKWNKADVTNNNSGNKSHNNHEQANRDLERRKSDGGNLRSKGKSVSMSHGLNLIVTNSNQQNGQNFAMSHPKFTGSLKDLIGVDKEIVPIETLKLANSSSSNTLPGNWKVQGLTRSESSLKLFGKPSLFQLLQNYNLYAIRVKLPENFIITENLRMVECEVVLPSPWMYGKDSTATSPKGSVPKLGGPNSAFKPVASGNASTIKSVSMVTILDFTSELLELIEPGLLQKGDLIVEVNT